ncbi:hypothetical protein PED38_15595 [Clavibacter sp. CT19]|uniref:hypothetical protein n=1 Tax=Clavibacter sp. CT19 TaxID=3018990 RepID=UPI0022EB096C|nr:hypothetical protein [Clavibacter sp. CT19]MDA3806223.1 hypothetical protein [Clavibacter sp. CT19]
MTNKVCRDSPDTTPRTDPDGPALYRTSPGGASIQDRSTGWPSRRYLATLVLDWDGWILTPRLGDGSNGPCSSAEAAFAWWLQHRDALPPPRRVWRNGYPWGLRDDASD